MVRKDKNGVTEKKYRMSDVKVKAGLSRKERKTRKIKCTGIEEAPTKHIFINKRNTEKTENGQCEEKRKYEQIVNTHIMFLDIIHLPAFI
jgi:hypothetical protein